MSVVDLCSLSFTLGIIAGAAAMALGVWSVVRRKERKP